MPICDRVTVAFVKYRYEHSIEKHYKEHMLSYFLNSGSCRTDGIFLHIIPAVVPLKALDAAL